MMTKEDDEESNDNYIGRTVKKFFLGFGCFYGKVISFNRTRKFYKVKYDDGDREELDLKELKEVLVDDQRRFVPSTEKSISGRGRKRGRDSAEKDMTTAAAIAAGAGGGRPENISGMNSAGQGYSPFRLEEVEVLNAQTKEIYKQLRGDKEVGENGSQEEDDQLLEPLIPISLASVLDESVIQEGFKFDYSSEDGLEMPVGPFGDPGLVDGTSPYRLKRTRVTPASEYFLLQTLPVEGKTDENNEVETDKKKETVTRNAGAPVSPVAIEADLTSWNVDSNVDLWNYRSGDGYKQKKTEFSALVLSLPPSSKSIGALDDSVVDLFQVYSLIRSFSNMIFLSPFSLEEFAYAITSTEVCALIDCVHLSLLQALRRQLERLSRNGSKSATFTLRLSDWSLLDYITWPSFLLGYMLTQGFNFDRGKSNLKTGLSTLEYYTLPLRTKLTVLGFLCDKVLDTDEARAELARRAILENDPDSMETKGYPSKKQLKESIADRQFENEFSRQGSEEASVYAVAQELLPLPSGASSIRVGRHLDEDGNLDECVLCEMDGNLICCDGCPAAYHSRCVGVTKQGLPPGDWFCPECRADKHDSRGARISRGVRGGELLAIGPDSQLLFYTCGYLLISEAGPKGQVIHRYYSPSDLKTVTKTLEDAGPIYTQLQIVTQQLYHAGIGITTATARKAAAVEVSSIAQSSKNDSGYHEQFCRSIAKQAGEFLLEAEKVVLTDSFTSDQMKIPDSNVSDLMLPTVTCEAPITTVSCRLEEESGQKQNLHMADSSIQANAVHCITDSFTSLDGDNEKTLLMSCDGYSKGINHDLHRDSMNLSWELENIWDEHIYQDSGKQRIVQSTEVKSNEHRTDKCRRDNVDQLSIGVQKIESGPDSNVGSGALDEGNGFRLGTSQEVHTGDLAARAFLPSPGKFISEQLLPELKDLRASLGKHDNTGNRGSGSWEKDLHYLSTVTQINACSYVNKYANCDLVATAAFNMASMSGGFDDLVDDKIGAPKKLKPCSVTDQLKAFTQASSQFYWPSVKKRAKDLPKEKCGWCINCRSTSRRGCLLTQVAGQMAGGAALVVGGIRPLKIGFGHFPEVAAYILYMEENLHGLLVGLWEVSGHRKKWRKQVEQAKSLKNIGLALLQMEASMRKVVLSPDWDKVEEDAPESIASSAISISTASLHVGKKVAPKRRGRPSVVGKLPQASSYDGACFGVKWWRGGSLSRKVYNWESLSKIAIKRAGRQGGFKEIPDLVYYRCFDLPRRTRRFAWQTRLEKLFSLAQVAVEVRYLDTFIKWNDIISPLQASTTHNIKGPVESEVDFWKSEIRTMSEEDGVVKYLLGVPTDTDEKMVTSTGKQQLKDVGPHVESPEKLDKKYKAAQKVGVHNVWLTESQVPLFLLKDFVEKRRSENRNELPKSAKKGKVKVNNEQKKLSFWKMLCSPRVAGVLESEKRVCQNCKLTCSDRQRVKCQRCSGEFHRYCTQVEKSINGQEKVPVCRGCSKVRQGQRTRKPSYKMLVMHSQLSDGSPAFCSQEAVFLDKLEGASPNCMKLRWKKNSPTNSTSQPGFELFGKQKKKKMLLSVPTPSQLHDESTWMEENSKKEKKCNKNSFITVLPCQYEGGESIGLGRKKMKTLTKIEEMDLPRSNKNQVRKKKVLALVPAPAEQKQALLSLAMRTSGRVKNNISPISPLSPSIADRQLPQRSKSKHIFKKESIQLEKSMPTRSKDSLAAAHNNGGVDRLPLKRKRLKIIFAGLEVAGQGANNIGAHEVEQKRKTGNGLDFGCRSAKSKAEILKFQQERVVLDGQVVSKEIFLPACGLCSEPYAHGHAYISCEYCTEWYHGAAVGLKPGDAAYLVGFKCHRCRKCRAPSCPFGQNPASKIQWRSSVDHGEVIDAENMNTMGHSESATLQSSWFTSLDKDFSAFRDAKAFPDFVAATNEEEEALATDGSNFVHDVLSHSFDMNDLVLSEHSQMQLNPLTLEDQQVKVWANSSSAQLDLPVFTVSRSAQATPPLSFTELLASEDDIFEGVAGTGLGLSSEWSGGMYGSSSLLVLPNPPERD